jgi:glutathione S-transferase
MRIRWLLAELGVPYDDKEYNFYNRERIDPDYLKLNPGGTFPTLEDDGLVITESGAMINYILRHYGNGRFMPKPGSREEAMVDQWMYWSEGNFAIHQRYFWDHSVPSPACISDTIPEVGEEGKRQAIKYSLQLELALRDTGYVVGDELTGADFMLSFPLYLADELGWFETRPKIRAYIERMKQRPHFRKALVDETQACLDTLFINPEFESWRDYEGEVEMWR